jgi:hypothetical protein
MGRDDLVLTSPAGGVLRSGNFRRRFCWCVLGVPYITTLQQRCDVARALGDRGPRVVVEGGHAVADTEDEVVDVVWVEGEPHQLRAFTRARLSAHPA